MSNSEDALALYALRKANKTARTVQELAELPPVGVRVWEVLLAYSSGIVIASLFYFSGASAVTCLAVGGGFTGIALGVAACTQTRRIARRLAALEAALKLHRDSA